MNGKHFFFFHFSMRAIFYEPLSAYEPKKDEIVRTEKLSHMALGFLTANGLIFLIFFA